MAPKSSSKTHKRKSVKPYSKEPSPSPSPKHQSSNKNNNNNNNKALFQRIWSEGDEIELLKGLKTFLANKKSSSPFDLTAFHKFIHKSLSFHVTVTQLSEKLRRTKKKYKNNATNAKTFTKPHDQQVFDLSTKIWSLDDSQQQPTNTPDAAAAATKASFSDWDFCLGDGSVGGIVKEGLSLLGNDNKVVELEDKWKVLHIAELELFLKKVQLMREQIMVSLETCKTV